MLDTELNNENSSNTNSTFVLQKDTQLSIRQCILWSRLSGLLSILNILLGTVQFGIGFLKGNSTAFAGAYSFLLSTLISILIAYQLLSFASRLKKGLTNLQHQEFLRAFRNIKIFFLIMGVLFIILICLMFVGMGILILSLFIR